MILQHHIVNIDSRCFCGVSEVKYQLHLREILAWNIALPEDIVLTCFQTDVIDIDDGISIRLVGEFHGHTVDILISTEDDGEVIAGCSIDVKISMKVHLSLPAVEASIGHSNSIVIVTCNKTGLHFSSTIG